MKRGLILLQSLLLSGVSAISLFASGNNEIKKDVSVVETIDLTNIESEYLLVIDMPNIYKKLLEFKENQTSVTDLNFALTNPTGDSFNWTEAYPDDVDMLNYLLARDDLEFHRLTFYASAYAPYINYFILYYYDPDQPVPETADAIGRFDWRDMDRDLWKSFWTKDVKLTYQIEV